MREILFRGKNIDNGKWIYGGYVHLHKTTYCYAGSDDGNNDIHRIVFERMTDWNLPNQHMMADVLPETVGQYTGLTDKNGVKIFEGDVVQYNTYDDFDCQSVVKFGEYNQDGSAGEYSARKCIGFYVDVDNFTCPDWCEDAPDYFPKHFKQQNVLEVARDCQVIGNIHDNPEILEGGGDNG